MCRLLDRLSDWLVPSNLRGDPSRITAVYTTHRRGFKLGWTACLLSVLACYVLYVAGLAILNTPLPPAPPAPDAQHAP